MFSYICIGTNELSRSVVFYDAVMAPLGHTRFDLDLDGGNASWGLPDPGPHLWVTQPFDKALAHPGNGTMFSLLADTRLQVDKVHAAAMATGGICNGKPGLRPQYGPQFYAAYLRDPDNKFNVVCYADGK
jgi:catechol 2,3-dioxygenase-like lactoylglutathione lyase family enzyme